jgi:outer membrane protein TolC
MRGIFLLLLFLLHEQCSGQGKGLDYFISQAKNNSPALRTYNEQLFSLRLDSQILKASLGPQVEFQSNDSYAPVINGWGYDEAITNIANVTALVKASRNFLTRGNIAAQYQTIALQRRALLDSLLLSQQDLVRAITEQYITAYTDLVTEDYNREAFDMMAKEEQLLKKLTEKSVFKQVDYLSFYITMQQQELNYLQARIQYNTDFLTLNYLSGIVDTVITRIEKPFLPDTLSTAFFESVFYTRFITDSLRLENERTLIKYSYRPKIGAYADGGYTSSLQFQPNRNFGFSGGLSLVIPIYDGRQRNMKLAQVDTRERTRQANRDYYIAQYRMQVQSLMRQLRDIDELVEKISRQIEFSRTLVTANNKLLETGDISIKDYVLALNSFLTAQNLLTQNRAARLKILGQLSYWNLKP